MVRERRRRSIRLLDVDYSLPGYYFITICVKNRSCLFGDIKNGIVELNELGNAVKNCWLEIPKHYQNIVVDEFVIMPNHVHGILLINDNEKLGVQNIESLRQPIATNDVVGAQYFVPQLPGQNKYQQIVSGSIGSIVRGFKIGVTKWWRKNDCDGILWQRNYYEHIIRDDKSLNTIRQYIRDNPINWFEDEENPTRIVSKN